MTPLQLAHVHQGQDVLSSTSATMGMGYLRLVSELEHHIGTPVKTFSQLYEATAADFILFSGADLRATLESCSGDIRDRMTSRVIPLNASRPRIFERLLEPLQIPGAIDSMSFVEWELQPPQQKGARGLYGLRDIGATIGASCGPFQSEHYCILQSETHHGLPHLLADYLSVLRSERHK